MFFWFFRAKRIKSYFSCFFFKRTAICVSISNYCVCFYEVDTEKIQKYMYVFATVYSSPASERREKPASVTLVRATLRLIS